MGSRGVSDLVVDAQGAPMDREAGNRESAKATSQGIGLSFTAPVTNNTEIGLGG